MTPPGEAARELEQLLMALVDGELTAVQCQHLAALLRDDPALQKKYRDYLLLDALLSWEQPEVATATAAAPPRRLARAVRLVGALAAGLLLVIGGYLLHSWREPPGVVQVVNATTSPQDAGERPAPGLAVLTRSVHAEWAPGSRPRGVGGVIDAGPLKLLAGLVQLEFYCGATLVVEGPADLELLATDRLRCRAGKLRATVPPQARGFTVLSATADFVDRGTEFGLEIAANGAAEVHVFAGKVEVHDAGSGRGDRPKAEVEAGRALKVEEGGRRSDIPADARHFASADEVERQARQAMAERHEQWQRAVEQLRRDPRVVVHYPFRGRQRPERRLRAANAPDGSLDGVIIGCEWVNGRWPEKRALEFKCPADRVRLTIPGEFDALTLVTWVRVDTLEHRFNALFLTDGFEVGAPHWQITDQGRLRLGICHGTDGTRWLGTNYDSEEVFPPDQMGQWKHLAVVYDNTAGQVRHYVNGRQVGQEELQVNARLSVGNVELGNWGAAYAGDRTPLRALNGRMDEFVLFRAALSAEEIGALFRAGEPIR
jgi:hypothetical protein